MPFISSEDAFTVTLDDFMTQLDCILGYAALLKKSRTGPDLRRFMTDEILDCSRWATTIAADLRNASSLDGADGSPNKHPLILDRLIKDIVSAFAILCFQQGIRLTYETPGVSVAVQVDSNLVARVVRSLLSMAIKRSSRGMRIAVSITDREQEVVMTVADEGAERREDEPSEVERHLSFLRSFVEAQGGRLWAENDDSSKRNKTCLSVPKGG